MTATTDDLTQEALVLRGWGWPVFPVAKKVPRVPWKQFQRRRPSDREIGRMFHLDNVDGIGGVPGPFSGGVANRDYDVPDSYLRWAADNPQIARITPTVETGRGYHVWFKSTIPMFKKMPDGELRGDGKHFCVLPPTRHPSGTDYAWLNGPPLGPSEFPLLDPFKAGFLTVSHGPECFPTGHKALADSGTPDAVTMTLSLASRGHKAFFSSLPSLVPSLGSDAVASEGEVSESIREAIWRTLPTREGERNGQLHQFARAMRDHVRDDAPPGLLFDAVRFWWQLALPVIGTKDFGTTLADFRRAFAAVRVPMSRSRPLVALQRGAACGSDSRSRLLNACCALAAEMGGTFFLSARTAGERIGVAKSHADRLLKELVATGQLLIVKKGKSSATRRRGTTVYRLPAFPGRQA